MPCERCGRYHDDDDHCTEVQEQLEAMRLLGYHTHNVGYAIDARTFTYNEAMRQRADRESEYSS